MDPVRLIRCPRCLSVNGEGKATCWNCFSPLPTTLPEGEKPKSEVTIPEAPVAPASQMRNISEGPQPKTTPRRSSSQAKPVSQPVVKSAEVIVPSSSVQRSEPFRYIAEQQIREHGRGAFWTMAIMSLLVLASLAVGLSWYYLRQPDRQSASAKVVMHDYMHALINADFGIQQQLASEDSKGLPLPSWLIISAWKSESRLVEAHGVVTTTITLQLAPPSTDNVTDEPLQHALEGAYQISLRLVPESGGWRVDQQYWLKSLHDELRAKNPKVKFPAWE